MPTSKRVVVDYSEMQPSTSSAFAAIDSRVHARISSSTGAPLERKMQAYFHRIALVPSQTIRKSAAAPIWTNSHEIREEKKRNGTLREEDRERRKQREEEREKAPTKSGHESSDYEDTDAEDPDDDYTPKPPTNKSVQKGEKRRRGRPPKDRDQPLPISKVSRRASVAVSNHRQSRAYDIDDVYMPDVSGLPQKIDYKEIIVPRWSEIDLTSNTVSVKPRSDCGYCSTSLNDKVVDSHREMEMDERRRFQAARDRDMGGGRKDGKNMNDLGASVGKKNFLSLDGMSDKDIVLLSQSTEVIRPSIARPYSPRSFNHIM